MDISFKNGSKIPTISVSSVARGNRSKFAMVKAHCIGCGYVKSVEIEKRIDLEKSILRK